MAFYFKVDYSTNKDNFGTGLSIADSFKLSN